MFGTIKSLLDIAVKIGSAGATIKKAKAEREMSSLGRDLFLIYVRGIEAVENGHLVLDAVVSYLEEIERTGDSRWISHARGRVKRGTNEQMERVVKLARAVQRLKAPLYAMDSTSARYLSALFHKKIGFLLALSDWLDEGEFPVYDDIETLLKADSERSHAPGEHKSEDETPHLTKLRESLGVYRPVSGKTVVQVHEERREKSAAYIEECRCRLQQIEEALAALRKALLESFNLSDVLLQIRDERIERFQ